MTKLDPVTVGIFAAITGFFLGALAGQQLSATQNAEAERTVQCINDAFHVSNLLGSEQWMACVTNGRKKIYTTKFDGRKGF